MLTVYKHIMLTVYKYSKLSFQEIGRKEEAMFTIEKRTMSNQVLFYLRKEIMLNKLREGHHLKETEIASQLNVSRGPVREALTQLEIENLVEKRSNGRTVVEKFERKDIENLYNARILLENAALADTDMETFRK